MIDFQPPPTYAEVILNDEITGRPRFNPIWLKWFLDLTHLITISGGGGGAIGGASFLSINVAGGTDVTLTSAQALNTIIEFVGLITANINVIVPAAMGEWSFYNNTTGAFTITIKAPATAGIVLEQGYRGIFYCNGATIARSNDSVAA